MACATFLDLKHQSQGPFSQALAPCRGEDCPQPHKSIQPERAVSCTPDRSWPTASSCLLCLPATQSSRYFLKSRLANRWRTWGSKLQMRRRGQCGQAQHHHPLRAQTPWQGQEEHALAASTSLPSRAMPSVPPWVSLAPGQLRYGRRCPPLGSLLPFPEPGMSGSRSQSVKPSAWAATFCHQGCVRAAVGDRQWAQQEPFYSS